MGTSGRRLMAGALVLAAGQAWGQVEWQSGVSEAAPMNGAQLSAALSNLSSMSTHGVVQFDRPILAFERAALGDAGLALLAPLGNNAYFASVSADARAGDITAAAPLASVQTIDLAWKWHPMLAAGNFPSYAVIENEPGNPDIAVYVAYHRDVDLDGAIMAAPEFGATVIDVLETVNGAVVHVPQSNLAAFAADDDVQWIEPVLP